MAHKHSVYDTDAHFSINPFTRAIKNESTSKVAVIQHDHNSERFTFEIPRLVDGHDMSVCDRVEVHYINMDSANKDNISADIYEVDDLQVSPDDRNYVICSWLLSRNATKYAGSLNFLVRFVCLDGEKIAYAWHTAIFTGISVSSGILNNAEEIIEPYVDVLAQWKADLFGVGDTEEQRLLTVSAEQQAAIAAKGAAVLESIPEEYTALNQNVDVNAAKINELASAIKGKLSGEAVRADDVSPVEHKPFVLVRGKNLFDISKIETGTSLTNNGDGKIIVAAGAYHVTTGKKLFELCPRLSVGDVCVLSFENLSPTSKFFHLSITGTWFPDKAKTITREMLNSTVAVYGVHPNDENYGSENVISDIQIEFGETATEYTPYIDPATVTVARHGKNLLKPSNISGHVAYHATNDLYTISDTGSRSVHTLPVPIPKGTQCTVRVEIISGKITNPATSGQAAVIGGYHVGDDGNSWQCAASFPNGEGVNLAGRVITATATVTETVTDIYFFFYASAVTIVEPIICKVQFEIGDTATEYEAYQEEQILIPNADGTVSGMTSLSPCMTILTDTEGVIVECEYNIDTKTYIDKKIAELLEGS